MAYDFKAFERNIAETEEWLQKELAAVRTGRAAPALLDSIAVEAYGTKMPLNQVASVSVEGPRTLRVGAWDAGQVKAIEKAISQADLGVSVSVDEAGVRVSFPELTADRRESLKKIARERLEHARITLRGARDEIWSDIQEKTRDGELSEDEKFRLKDAMEKLVKEGNEKLEAMAERKEKEIQS